MATTGLLGVLLLAAIAGLLIGCVGIGGVILVPALSFIGGVPVHTAIPAAVAAYLVSGLVGSITYYRAGSVSWGLSLPLAIGAMPASFAGALVSGAAPASVIELCIGLLTGASGINAFVNRGGATGDANREPGWQVLVVAGAVTGFLSALTGTGGPLVLVPILMWMRCPILPAVGLAQVIQLPIALLATAGNLGVGEIDIPLAVTLAVGLAAGTWGGAHIAHQVPRETLRRIVAGILSATGGLILLRVAARLLV